MTIPPVFAAHTVPDLWAGATARSLLLEIHTAIGHQSGAMEEMGRQVSELARTLHGHVEEEICIASQMDALVQNSKERHELLHMRLDTLEQYATTSRIRWGVFLAVGGGICTLFGGAIAILATVGSKPAFDVIMKWLLH